MSNKWIILLALLFASSSHAQETTIRILGAYVSDHSLSASDMSAQLQGIADAWNISNLPGTAVTTVQLLNSAVAVPVAFPNLPTSVSDTALNARLNPAITALRHAWQADVIILFRAHNPNEPHCGVTFVSWANGNFVPSSGGLDLRYRHDWYISVVVPSGCPSTIAAHEFGHMAGGGHFATGDRLYPDGRAHVELLNLPELGLLLYIGSALADSSDVPLPLATGARYSRNSPALGGPNHQNARTLAVTARSMANFYEYPSVPPVLNPPINLVGSLTACDSGWTRHDVWWQDDPGTNVPITHYDVWYSQPIGNPDTYGWTVYGPYSPVYVIGADSRIRTRACNGNQCSALSNSFYDALIWPACNW